MTDKKVKLEDLNAMLEKLEKAQVDDLMMVYAEGLREAVQKKDFKAMFTWSAFAFVINELLEELEKNETKL